MFGRLFCWLFVLTLSIEVALAIDTNAIAQKYFGNDSEWYANRIPFFESSDRNLDEIYYYRWQLFRAHQRDLGHEYGYITTEFLDNVSWQFSPWASLNDATGFHLNEGRWCRDRRFTHDYVEHMFGSRNGNNRQYSEYMADSVWNVYLIDHDAQFAVKYLEQMKTLYEQWNDHLDASKGLYYIEPLWDATEFTIASIDASGGKEGFAGGNAFRPSINSYMFANFRAIAKLARLNNDELTAHQYERRAELIKDRVEGNLWNSTFQHFIDRYQVENQYVKYFDFIRGRELVGYVPFMFSLPNDTQEFAASWSHVLNPDELLGAYGMRTNEPSYQYYMHAFTSGNQWNGPVWPYQTTQALLGMSNVLDHYENKGPLTICQFNRLLNQYVDLHYGSNGKPNLQEEYHPDKGYPIVGFDRSAHYFHSGFIDIVLGGLVGIRPRSDDKFEINPLVDDISGPTWFLAQDVPYHGSNIAIQYDRDGTHYGQKGLIVKRDGQQIANSTKLQRIVVNFPPKRLSSIDRPKAVSVQLQESTDFPRGSASSNIDTIKIHQAIDGRVWYQNELPNGWESDITSNQWYAIQLAKDYIVSRAEIAWYADDIFATPISYSIESSDSTDGPWNKVMNLQMDAPLPNGITHANWSSLSTKNVRLTFTLPPGTRARLVELKIF